MTVAPVLLDLVVQGAPADAQRCGGGRPVSGVQAKGGDDRLPLDALLCRMTRIDPLSLTMTLMTLACASAVASSADASVTVLQQFNPGLGTLVGCGHDATTGSTWVYPSFGATLSSYSAAGVFLSSIPRPGEAANDVDIEFAPEALSVGATVVPAGTLLFIDGETGVAEIYAVDKNSGAILATLTTGFGVSHVVGGAYHPIRNTFFLVQDKVPGGVNANRVAEVDPVSGNVLGSFSVAGVFSVNFGDIEVSGATGNLLLVSSDEPRIAEFTPTGVFIADAALPAGVVSLSGIGLGSGCGQAWVTGTGGTVSRLGGVFDTALFADLDGNGTVDGADLGLLLGGFGTPDPGADLNDDGSVDGADLGLLLGAFGTTCS